METSYLPAYHIAVPRQEDCLIRILARENILPTEKSPGSSYTNILTLDEMVTNHVLMGQKDAKYYDSFHNGFLIMNRTTQSASGIENTWLKEKLEAFEDNGLYSLPKYVTIINEVLRFLLYRMWKWNSTTYNESGAIFEIAENHKLGGRGLHVKHCSKPLPNVINGQTYFLMAPLRLAAQLKALGFSTYSSKHETWCGWQDHNYRQWSCAILAGKIRPNEKWWDEKEHTHIDNAIETLLNSLPKPPNYLHPNRATYLCTIDGTNEPPSKNDYYVLPLLGNGEEYISQFVIKHLLKGKIFNECIDASATQVTAPAFLTDNTQYSVAIQLKIKEPWAELLFLLEEPIIRFFHWNKNEIFESSRHGSEKNFPWKSTGAGYWQILFNPLTKKYTLRVRPDNVSRLVDVNMSSFQMPDYLTLLTPEPNKMRFIGETSSRNTVKWSNDAGRCLPIIRAVNPILSPLGRRLLCVSTVTNRIHCHFSNAAVPGSGDNVRYITIQPNSVVGDSSWVGERGKIAETINQPIFEFRITPKQLGGSATVASILHLNQMCFHVDAQLMNGESGESLNSNQKVEFNSSLQSLAQLRCYVFEELTVQLEGGRGGVLYQSRGGEARVIEDSILSYLEIKQVPDWDNTQLSEKYSKYDFNLSHIVPMEFPLNVHGELPSEGFYSNQSIIVRVKMANPASYLIAPWTKKIMMRLKNPKLKLLVHPLRNAPNSRLRKILEDYQLTYLQNGYHFEHIPLLKTTKASIESRDWLFEHQLPHKHTSQILGYIVAISNIKESLTTSCLWIKYKLFSAQLRTNDSRGDTSTLTPKHWTYTFGSTCAKQTIALTEAQLALLQLSNLPEGKEFILKNEKSITKQPLVFIPQNNFPETGKAMQLKLVFTEDMSQVSNLNLTILTVYKKAILINQHDITATIHTI